MGRVLLPFSSTAPRDAVFWLEVHPVLFHIGAIVIPSYGALAALGVLLALVLAQRTARTAGLAPNDVWNLCVIALFAGLAGSRILLIVVNWRDLMSHPMWMLGLATIHHPLLAAAGVFMGALAAMAYARRRRMPAWATADTMAAPLALGLACEQLGALLAGSGYGTDATVRWAVVYTSELAARWSGTPLGVPLHPVQAYAALAYLTLSILALVCLPALRQQGDAAGLLLMGTAMTMYITELWRDPEGRGQLLHGALDGPQIAAVALVLAGGVMLRERTGNGDVHPQRNEAEHA